MLSRRQVISASAASLLTAGGFAAHARAATLDKVVHVIVGFPAGGGTDIVARVLAQALQGNYASSMVKDRPGASARLAVEYVKNAPADGSVMLFTPDFPMTLYPSSFKALKYDPLTDFIAVGPAATGVLVLVVGPGVPADVQDARGLRRVGQGKPRQGQRRRHIGGRDTAFHHRDAGARGESHADAGALPRRGAGHGRSDRRPCTGQRQSGERTMAFATRRQSPGAGGDRRKTHAVSAGRADHEGAGFQRRGRIRCPACSCRPRRRRPSSPRSTPRCARPRPPNK